MIPGRWGVRIHNSEKLYSSQDMKDFIECKFALDLDIRSLSEKIDRVEESEWTKILFKKGNDFEDDFVNTLKNDSSSEKTLVEIPTDESSLEERVAATISAMKSGSDYIFQAALHSGKWHGYADILRKVDGLSSFGDYSYEVVDIKSRLEPSTDNILQVSLYSYLLSKIQEITPKFMYIVTGDRK
jgi:predicted RecB family nuclease